MKIMTPGIILVIFINAALADEFSVSSATEISSAMTMVQPGDTLTMTNGIWNNQEITFYGNGNEHNPILLRAGEPGHVILTGTSRLQVNGSYLIVNGLYFLGSYGEYYKVPLIDFKNQCHDCRLTNTAMVNCNPENWRLLYKWVQAGGTHNRIDHCYFSGKNHEDALLKILIPNNGPGYSRVDHNYFGDIPVGKTNNGWETIRIQGPQVAAGKTIVEDNLFYRCDGEIEIISLKAGDNDIRRNTFYESMGTLTCRLNTGNRIYNNFFIGNDKRGTGGIRMYSKDHIITNNYFENLNGSSPLYSALSYMTAQVGMPEVENVLAAFNTMVNCRYTIEIAVGRDAGAGRIIPPRGLRFANNIAINSAGDFIHYREDVTGISYEGNILYGTDIGIPITAGIDTIDPKLYPAPDNLWRLSNDSPAIDNAVGDYTHVMIDLDGQPRNDGHHDIGADEFSSAPILNRPLTRDDVGPDWIKQPDLPVALSIVKAGSGCGTVTLDPPVGVYAKGTAVTLTATPDTDNQFGGWSDDLSGSENPVTILMNSHKTITATFVPPTTYNLATWITGSGTVLFDPPGGTYHQGTVVKVTAAPADGWEFNHWGGALTGSANPDSITLTRDTGILAFFTQSTSIRIAADTPSDYRLYQNYPNPFNHTTNISFYLKEPGITSLKIYDTVGHQVAEVKNQYLPVGPHVIQYDASNLGSGVYICKMNSGRFTRIIKMILVK